MGVQATRFGFSGDYANFTQATPSRPDATGEIQVKGRGSVFCARSPGAVSWSGTGDARLPRAKAGRTPYHFLAFVR